MQVWAVGSGDSYGMAGQWREAMDGRVVTRVAFSDLGFEG